jgi:phosphopantothenoylcysteine decarboxylase/phosphopantothenate--cysteine ligase
MTFSIEAAAAEVAATLGLMADARPDRCRFLITAGPTCEDLDPVRFLSNRSTGRTGLALAEAAAEAEHQVLLVMGPTLLPLPKSLPAVRVRCAREMEAAVLAAFDWCDALFMSAAVADYRPAAYHDNKIHKTADDLTLRLVRNPDILESISRHRADQAVVGFSLDSRLDVEEAEAKRVAKGMDLIVANTEHAFGGVSTDAVVLERDREPCPAGPTKEKLAEYLVKRAAEIVKEIRSQRTPSMRFAARRRPLPEEHDE